jgi:predicted transport protein
MAIFKINKNKVTRCAIKEDGFGDEFALRDFFAANLEDLLGIRFIEKEYPIQEGRIDTLGLDENNSPVIIEYKWKENEEVLAQGLFYYNWLLKNKKHFELLVENRLGKNIKVKWEQPRVILVAQGFGRYIQGAVEQEKHIELLSYHHYAPDILHLESVYTPPAVKGSKRAPMKVDGTGYNLDYHLAITSDVMKKKFQLLRERLLQLPEVEEKDNQKSGISYRTTKSFVRFEFRPTWIMVLLRDPEYRIDTKKLVKDVTSNEWGYKGMLKFTPEVDTDYAYELIKQSHESTL